MASTSRWLSYTVLVSGNVGTRVAAHGVGGCSWHHGGCRGVGGSGTHLDDRPLIALVSIGPQRPVPDGAISHLLFRESLAHLGGCIPLLIFLAFAVSLSPPGPGTWNLLPFPAIRTGRRYDHTIAETASHCPEWRAVVAWLGPWLNRQATTSSIGRGAEAAASCISKPAPKFSDHGSVENSSGEVVEQFHSRPFVISGPAVGGGIEVRSVLEGKWD